MDAFVKRLPRGDGEAQSIERPLQNASAAVERPTKRQKRDEISDSESESEPEEPIELVAKHEPTENTSEEALSDEKDQRRAKERVTDFENALPPTEASQEAIEEYETLKSSQSNAGEEIPSKKIAPLWIKGRSSIYVDAFNLTLDTVLEEESSLFSSKELEIFSQWKKLNYEAQYL
jgi:Fanconi-associated nuclease 1